VLALCRDSHALPEGSPVVTDICERLIVARGVAALDNESTAWSRSATPEGAAAGILATTGANLDSRSTWLL
jgi:hypothetical protein